ncbi:RdgB/HAM1 family non-canonical purine NTP pyrophosphatase [Marinicella sediminis]|uniref:dITP/XTP pyrophosphatase n=1 Tax=Marinicella sediminis TaxID=1792834 RepID=A0ABV7J8K7_9GAMM
MNIILASGNAGKLKEFSQAFADLGIALQPQPKTVAYEVAETGTTFIENAIIKARHASQLSGLPALADDSGLIVPVLQGQPGVRSARYAGDDASDQQNVDKLLIELAGSDVRSAHFYCCLVFMRHHLDPDPLIAKGLWHGEISTVASGEGGFGYDPVFFIPSLKCTAAELEPEQKKQLSHRGQAIRQLHPQLASLL